MDTSARRHQPVHDIRVRRRKVFPYAIAFWTAVRNVSDSPLFRQEFGGHRPESQTATTVILALFAFVRGRPDTGKIKASRTKTVSAHYFSLVAASSFSMTWSIENVAGRCRGGNSLYVFR